MKHTKGPWKIVDSNRIDEEARIITNRKEICRLYINMDGEDVSNARLIAAAPELLEALTECADRLSSFGLMEFVAKKIDPIIAKAKGPV